MSSRALPARPHLDHLKSEAKALRDAFRAGDADAVRRIRAVVGDKSQIKLADVQRVIARGYGFASWARLRANVQASRSSADAVEAFLSAVVAQNVNGARDVLRVRPNIAASSLHVAAVLGHVNDARKLIREDPSRVAARAGEVGGTPLLYLCYSPFHGESPDGDEGLFETARLLLDSGADPNTTERRWGVPALHGVTGQRSVPRVANLLLDAGANPTDGESLHHAAERFHEDALELLLARGADLNHTGEWGNTPLYFLLRWYDLERAPRVREGVVWLLEHGADPNVRCGREAETSLHVAARRGQSPAIIRVLLDHGADVTARRGDGRSAWLLAMRGGFDAITRLLESAGAVPEPLTPVDSLLAACGRGDVEAARQLSSPELLAALDAQDRSLLPEAAAVARDTTVLACLAAGFPVNTVDQQGATALHQAAIRGRAGLVRALIDANADLTIRDREHSSTPLGWAMWGADHFLDQEGDYADTVRVLLAAGATPDEDGEKPRHAGVRAALDEFNGLR